MVGIDDQHRVLPHMINRSYINSDEKMPQSQTFAAGLEFLEKNHQQDNWFLQIETFDPHEPPSSQ